MSINVPKIAVLLAAYNGMEWIEEQIASILAQKEVDVTLFISVDSSTDGTEEWCAALAAKMLNVNLLPSVGRLGGAARNFFRLMRDVDFAGFKFVAFSDQDDIWYLNKLQRAVAELDRHKVDGYSSNVVAFWSDEKAKLLVDKAQPQVALDYWFEAAGPGCTYVVRVELAGQLKALICSKWSALQDVSLHDWFCYAYARSHGYRWYIDPVPTMEYRQHEYNEMGANVGLFSLLRRYKAISNGWWFGQVQLIAQLLGREVDPIVRGGLALRRPQLVRLSLKSWQCRRRPRDKFLFFLICWIQIIKIGKC